MMEVNSCDVFVSFRNSRLFLHYCRFPISKHTSNYRKMQLDMGSVDSFFTSGSLNIISMMRNNLLESWQLHRRSKIPCVYRY
jgi:hypothetical protein